MTRRAAAIAALLASLALATAGCAGNGNPQQESVATSSGDYVIEDSFNTVGQVIGQRAVMQMSKADAKAMSAKEFSKLVDEETTAADSDDADYLTIDFGDGTGIVFPSCTAEFFFYGKLDSEGMTADKCVTYHRDGTRWVQE